MKLKMLLLLALLGFGSSEAARADAVPIGYLGFVNSSMMNGWACVPYMPPALPTPTITVHFYATNLQDESGLYCTTIEGDRACLFATGLANQTRSDVVASCGDGNRGFSVPTAASLKDCRTHKVYAFAINPQAGGTNPRLPNVGSPEYFPSLTPDPTRYPSPGLITGRYAGAGLPPKVLSLTYDDGPVDPATVSIAQYLYDEGIRATFFVTSGAHHSPCNPHSPCACPPAPPEASRPMGIIQTVAALGHRIGNHGHNHQALTYPGVDVRQQVCETQRTIDNLLGTQETDFFRPPGGCWDDGPCPLNGVFQLPSPFLTSEASFNRLVGPVTWMFSTQRDGLYTSDGDCANADNDGNGQPNTVQECANVLLNEPMHGILANPNLGGIVLLHDWIWLRPDGSSCSPQTGTMWADTFTRYLIPELKQRQYLLLPLDADPQLPGGLIFSGISTWTTNYAEEDGWGWGTDIGYYGTFRMGDINGDHRQDVCGRRLDGMHCNTSTGGSFEGPYVNWQPDPGSAFSDVNGFRPPQHSTTIQLGDIDGDGKSDICGLGLGGIVCAISSGSSFGTLASWLSNTYLPSGVYSQIGYYGAIRLGDVTGDGRADLCFRKSDGLYCAVSNGTSFVPPTGTWTPGYFTDAHGWSGAQYAVTIQLADIDGDGRSDVCARAISGLYCATSNGGAFVNPAYWSAGTTYRNFSDWDGFGISSGYYRTLRFGDADGDGKADACIRSAAGVLCARSTGTRFEAYRVWQKVDFGDVQGWLPDRFAVTFMLGDVTGDGRADLCARGYGGIVCARAP